MAKFKGQANIPDQSESDLNKELKLGLEQRII